MICFEEICGAIRPENRFAELYVARVSGAVAPWPGLKRLLEEQKTLRFSLNRRMLCAALTKAKQSKAKQSKAKEI